MPKKPSEWTPQEAWKESAYRHCLLWGLSPYEHQCDAFPSDPPERVSDEDLSRLVASFHRHSQVGEALHELIERRKAEKEQGR